MSPTSPFSELLEVVHQAPSVFLSIVTALVAISAGLIAFARAFFRFRIDILKQRNQYEKVRAEISSRRDKLRKAPAATTTSTGRGDTSTARVLVDTNFEILEQYYQENLGEYRLLSRSAISVSILGFLVIVVGAGLAFSGFTSVGIVSSVAGFLGEAATILFFNQLRVQGRQTQDYHKKLISTQYLMTAIALTSGLPTARQHDEVAKIINNLLFLSNELHGSRSDHLFGTTMAPLKDDPPPPPGAVEKFPPPKAAPSAA